MWANHWRADVFRTAPGKCNDRFWWKLKYDRAEFLEAIDYFIAHYFNQPEYYLKDGKVFLSIYSTIRRRRPRLARSASSSRMRNSARCEFDSVKAMDSSRIVFVIDAWAARILMAQGVDVGVKSWGKVVPTGVTSGESRFGGSYAAYEGYDVELADGAEVVGRRIPGRPPYAFVYRNAADEVPAYGFAAFTVYRIVP